MANELDANVSRDRKTDSEPQPRQILLRPWEHEDPIKSAQVVENLVLRLVTVVLRILVSGRNEQAKWHYVTVPDDGLFNLDQLRLPEDQSQDARAKAIRRTRNRFLVHPEPLKPMSSSRLRSIIPIAGELQDPAGDLQSLAQWFEEQPAGRDRFRWTLRDSLDELLDGQRTGRWCYQQLTKTEKTYLGTAIEINLTKEFSIPDGIDLDWNIEGTDVDCKFSKDIGGWEIPMEMYVCLDHGSRSGRADHPALVVWMNDDENEWAAGLLRITDERLRWKTENGARVRGYNRDNKRRIGDGYLRSIFWLWGGLHGDLPTNLLLKLSLEDRGAILAAGLSGQARVNELFRRVPGRLINRQVVLAVGQQDDAPKRVRDARIALRKDGIIILGHSRSHSAISKALGLESPEKGAWMSVRLAKVSPSDPCTKVMIDYSWWRITETAESDMAPRLPAHTSE